MVGGGGSCSWVTDGSIDFDFFFFFLLLFVVAVDLASG